MKIATVCSGIGSPEQALKNLEIEHEIVFACEIDKPARLTYLENFKPAVMLNDMTLEKWEDPNQYADLFIGGIPCQAFSLAGKRLGELDKRGLLFYDFYRYVKNMQPKVFIIENVKGLLSDNGGRTFENWLDLLAAEINGQKTFLKHEDCLGYNVFHTILNSKNFGVPQNRERVFIIGIRPDITFNFKFPRGFKLDNKLKDVLEECVDEKYYLSKKALNFITKPIRLQKKFTQINGEVGLTLTAKGNTNWTGDFIIEEGKINNSQDGRVFSSDGISQALSAGHNNSPKIIVREATKLGYAIAEPGDAINYSNSKTRRGRVGKGIANTLDTSCNQAVIEPYCVSMRGRNPENPSDRKSGSKLQQRLEPNSQGITNTITSVQKDNLIIEPESRIRRLTPLECLRLQGFPDDFIKTVSDTQLYKQSGNTITVGVIQAIIKNLLPILAPLNQTIL